jgi:antitoxin (DNA-binding transcriptional repressor) of toxin-antitoxin stability system
MPMNEPVEANRWATSQSRLSLRERVFHRAANCRFLPLSRGGTAVIQVTVAEAQDRLPALLSAAEAGETVTIRSESGKSFTLCLQAPSTVVNPAWPGYPHPGSAKGLIRMSDDFDEPLEELKEYME